MAEPNNDAPKFRITRLEDRVVPCGLWWAQEMIWDDATQSHYYPGGPNDPYDPCGDCDETCDDPHDDPKDSHKGSSRKSSMKSSKKSSRKGSYGSFGPSHGKSNLDEVFRHHSNCGP